MWMGLFLLNMPGNQQGLSIHFRTGNGVIRLGKHVPTWAFILWLAVQQRLNTTDRLVSLGLNVTDDCDMCGRGKESFKHLFFDCSYSREIGWSIFYFFFDRLGQSITSKNGISSCLTGSRILWTGMWLMWRGKALLVWFWNALWVVQWFIIYC